MRALIVDDEPLPGKLLMEMINKHCFEIEETSYISSSTEALKELSDSHYDIVFLDVEMPYGNAFDLLEKFDNPSFETIFVTAFSKYAIEAINLSASRYLLKPITIDDLIEATESVGKQ